MAVLSPFFGIGGVVFGMAEYVGVLWDILALLTNAEKLKADTHFERICLQKAILSQWRVSCEQLYHAL